MKKRVRGMRAAMGSAAPKVRPEPPARSSKSGARINRDLGDGPFVVTEPAPGAFIPMWHVSGPAGVQTGTVYEAAAYHEARTLNRVWMEGFIAGQSGLPVNAFKRPQP